MGLIVISGAPADPGQPMALYSNALARGTLAASSTAAGSYAANILGPQTYDGWQPAAMPATLAVTLAAAESCDACAIAAHTLGSAGATVYVERWTGAAWVIMAQASPTDNLPVLMIWPAASAAQWRLRVTGSAAPVLGVAMIGLRLIFPAPVRPPYVPADAARRVDMTAQRTLGGHYAGAVIKRREVETEAAFGPLPRSFADGALRAFRDHYDAGGTFFFAGGPEAMPQDVAYCWRPDGASELRPAYGAGGLWAAVTMRMAGYGA